MGLKVKLVKSHSGADERQLATIQGLGLRKLGQERILKDTPAIRGLVFHVRHLVSSQVVAEEPEVRRRMKPRKIRLRDQKRMEERNA